MAALVTPRDVLPVATSSWFAAADASVASGVADRFGHDTLTVAGAGNAPTVDDGFVTHPTDQCSFTGQVTADWLDSATECYIAGWVRMNAPTNEDVIVSLWSSTDGNRRVIVQGPTLYAQFTADGTAGTAWVQTAGTLLAGQWVFIEIAFTAAGGVTFHVNRRQRTASLDSGSVGATVNVGGTGRVNIGGFNTNNAPSSHMSWRHLYLSTTVPNAEGRDFLYHFEDPRVAPRWRTPRDVLLRARSSWLTYAGTPSGGAAVDVFGHGSLAVTGTPTVANQTVSMVSNGQQYLGSAAPTWLVGSTTQQYIGAWLRQDDRDASERYYFGVYFSSTNRRFSLRRTSATGRVGIALSADGSNFWVDGCQALPLGSWTFLECLVDTSGSAASRFFYDGVEVATALDTGTREATLFQTTTTMRLQVGGISGVANSSVFSFRHIYLADYLPSDAERRFLMTYDPPPGALAP